MSRLKQILVIVMLVPVAGGNVLGADWKVGEKWVYKHEGPRPYTGPSSTVEGDRTVEVTAIQGEGAEKRYLLKNWWGTGDANPATSYIDPNNMIHKLDIENMAVLTITPPIPAIWSLKIGEKKVIKASLDFGGFAIPVEYVATRLKNETITVPAGEFKDCQHVQVVSTMQNEMGEPVKNKAETWYHPKVKNSVKDVIITGYQGENSYASTSLLKSYTKKD